ncbi:MAG: hypothetical protein OSB34_16350 [Planktomarina sp.]|nr:hypothetical protein [Planktomarina sp.]
MSNKLVPAGKVVKLKLGIRRGNYNDLSQGWTDGYATKASTGSIYLNVEYSVTDGVYEGRKIFSQIGLNSPKGPWWRRRGRLLILSILNSAHCFSPNDLSKKALTARRLGSFKDFDGIEFSARIKVVKNQKGQLQNDIDEPIVPDTSDTHFAQPRLKQKDVTSKLTQVVAGPIWMQR